MPEVKLASREEHPTGCVGCHSRCVDLVRQSRQQIGEGDLALSSLAKAIFHTVGIPVLFATTLVGSVAAAGFGDGAQSAALLLGLAVGTLVCRPLSFQVV